MKWARVFHLEGLMDARLFGLDAVQGSKEKRASRMEEYGDRASYAADAVMRQEGWRSFGFAENRPARPKSSGGYTIIEVMVFLMISAVIFFGAVTVFQGQQGRSQFQQGMRDIASKIQRDVDGVGTSLIPGGDQYTCSVSAQTGRAQLSTGSSGVGTSQACIFLGRAIQVVPGQSKVFTYSVLGNHYTSDNEPVTSLSSALPEPAIAPGADLTDEYDAAWGKVLSSKVTYISGTDANSDLVGFYASLRDGYQNSSAAGGQSITAKGYNFTNGSLDSARSSLVKSCLEERNADGVNCASTPLISKWTVCFASTGSNQTALLSVSSTPSGVVMGTDFTNCS